MPRIREGILTLVAKGKAKARSARFSIKLNEDDEFSRKRIVSRRFITITSHKAQILKDASS